MARVTGVDGSQRNAGCGGQTSPRGTTTSCFYEAEATTLPVLDGTFDAAVSVQVLEYVPDVAAALAEIHRVLRPGGRIVIWDVDWATVSWHTADHARMRRMLDAWDHHLVTRRCRAH